MDLIRQLLAVAFVFALLWAALRALRSKDTIRFHKTKAPDGHSILESRGRLALSPQHSVHWVRIGERNLLLAVYPSGITLLGDVAPSDLSGIRPSELTDK